MSFRNLFVVHCNGKPMRNLIDNLQRFLNRLDYGFIYKPRDYQDELISKIEDCDNYFTITFSPNVNECDDIFSLDRAFSKSLLYPKKQQRIKEKEFLQEQFLFLDKVIDVIFCEIEGCTIEVYISDQVSNFVQDYFEVILNDRCLSRALADVYEPRKKENYIGFKTTKFIIK